MNFYRLKYALAGFASLMALSISVPVEAQLPPLPVHSAIQKGTLPCGVTYYMVTNPAEKGYAHVAVVQRDEPLSAAKQESLDTRFFARMGIAPGPDGFISDWDGSTVYRFADVPFYKPSVLDSTLLFTFARVAESRAQQAVIVSGDIDAVELKKKMDIFSMLVPRMLVTENHKPDYVWEPSPAPVVRSTTEGKPEVSVTYASARIPYELMNTAQAVVTDLFSSELRELLRHRLERNLSDAGIPYGEIGFKVLRSSDYGGDERYTVYVQVKQSQLDPAMRVIASTLGEMDSFGVSVNEFADAKQVLSPGLRRKASATPASEEFLTRCIANFLYGARLSPRQEELRYFSRKNVADSVETRLFNRFSAAMLEGLSNFTLEYSGAPDSLDHDDALFYYNLAYLYGSVARTGKDYAWHSADTAALQNAGVKVKLKGEKAEPVSGGVLWTFSNGMRVVFKQVKGSGTFSYALQLNGGMAQIPGLREGEGGHIGPMMNLFDVAGIPAPAFRDLLASNGISMDTRVELNSMDLSGSAPSDRLSLLLKALLAVANKRSPDASAFQAYCRTQQLQDESIPGALYHKLNPGYAHTPYSLPSALDEETQQKAVKFYEDRFSRMNDGVLILSGDLSEEGVKKLLTRYLGAFRTQRGTMVRKLVEMRTLSGTSTVNGTAGAPGFYVLMDTEYAMTAEHLYTARVAVDALKASLARHLAPYGVAAQVDLYYCVQPQERFQLLVSCPSAPIEALPAVRAAIEDASQMEEADVKVWKQKLEADVRSVMATPDGFVATLLARYSANKDVTSRYAAAIGSISLGQVQAFLSAMHAGGRVEYVSHE